MWVGLFFAPVAHEPVELLQRGVVVTAVALEGDGDVFAGVEMMEGERAGVAFGAGVLQRVVGAEHEQPGKAQSGTGARQSHNERTLARRVNSHSTDP